MTSFCWWWWWGCVCMRVAGFIWWSIPLSLQHAADYIPHVKSSHCQVLISFIAHCKWSCVFDVSPTAAAYTVYHSHTHSLPNQHCPICCLTPVNSHTSLDFFKRFLCSLIDQWGSVSLNLELESNSEEKSVEPLDIKTVTRTVQYSTPHQSTPHSLHDASHYA